MSGQRLHRLRVVWRYLEIVAAAVLLLVLIELHGAIVRHGLKVIGIAEQAPSILSIRACGNDVRVPIALRRLDDSTTPVLDCSDPAEIVALMPAPGPAVLLVNGVPLGQQIPSDSRLAFFVGVSMKPGRNHLLVAEAGTRLLYPLPVKDPPDLGRLLYFYGDPSPMFFDYSVLHWPDSLSLEVGGRSAQRGPAAYSFPYALSLIRNQNGDVEVVAEGCVEESDPLFAAARNGSLSGPLFLAMAFQAAVYDREGKEASDNAWSTRQPVVPKGAGEGCKILATDYVVRNGELMLTSINRFLSSPHHQLTLTGFTGRVAVLGRAADQVDGTQMVWRGREMSGRDYGAVVLNPTHEGARQQPRGAADATAKPRREGLIPALAALRELLPNVLYTVFWSLAAVAPVALILWTLLSEKAQLQSYEGLTRARAAVAALLGFMGALALLPLLLGAANASLGVLRAASWAGIPFDPPGVARQFSASVAVCLALLIVPLFRAAKVTGEPISSWGRRGGAALMSFALAIVAAAVLAVAQIIPFFMEMRNVGMIKEIVEWLDIRELQTQTLLAETFGLWLIASFILFWIPIYWLFRAAVSRTRVVATALLAGLLVFLLPLPYAMAEVMHVGLVFFPNQDVRMFAIFGPLSGGARGLAALGSILVVVVVIVIVLRAFREIAAEMLTPERAGKLRHYTRWPYLLLLTLLIAWPLIADLWVRPQSLDSTTFRLMSVFQAYGALLVLLAPLAMAQEFEVQSVAQPGADRFLLPESILALTAAAFAGYLTLWNREPLAVMMLMLAGWLVFRYAIIDSPASAAGRTRPGLAKQLIEYLNETRLLRARRNSLEKLFADGKLSGSTLANQRVELEKMRRQAETQLGMKPNEARRALLEYGPGPSPLANGMRGALTGIAVAALLQLIRPFDVASVDTHSVWTKLLAYLAVDPGYQVIVPHSEDSKPLIFLSELINAFAVWTIAGFLFGYVFHRVRGNDGFLKAAYFGAGIAIPYILAQALVSQVGGTPIAALGRLIPLIVFLLVVGVLVFDGATLRREKLELSKLPEIYGFRTSLGYASFAGGLAAIQPLLDFLGWLGK